MAFLARNAIPVVGSYDRNATFTSRDVVKLDVWVYTSDVYMQTDEDDPPPFDRLADTETRMKVGFHSIPFETPITGWRFKTVDAGTVAEVDFRAYG